MRKRVVILASGAGSITQAILDATDLDIQVVAVVSDKADAKVLERARQAKINTSVIELRMIEPHGISNSLIKSISISQI